MNTRMASPLDAAAIVAIYNQGIEEGATLETRPRSVADVQRWFDGVHPIVVVEDAGKVIAFAASFPYRPNRDCYTGVADFSIYVARDGRGRGAGRAAMDELIRAAERAGFWKLLSRIFPENAASRALLRSCGFREVGIYEKHGKREGVLRDAVIVERCLDVQPQ